MRLLFDENLSARAAREVAEAESRAAAAALAPLPDSAHKQSLLELASFSVTRRA